MTLARISAHRQAIQYAWAATVLGALLLNVFWPPYTGYSSWALSLVAFPVAAVLILTNRPGNPVGRVLAVVATAAGGIFIGGWVAATWRAHSWSVYVEALIAAFPPVLFWGAVALLYIFPTGSPPTRRLQLILKVFTVVVGVMVVLAPFEPAAQTLTGRANPLAGPVWVGSLYSAALVFFAPALIGGIWAATSRFRSSTGEVRTQMRWFMASLVAVAALVAVVALLPPDVPRLVEQVASAIVVIGFWSLPASVVVAVTRHNLYEIDRLISRTISYTVVVAALAGAFIGLVVAIGSIIGPNEPLAVAAATLTVAAAFNPLRRRVQHRVDRRFNRSLYRAEALAERFGTKLMEPLSSQEIMALWSETAVSAMQPRTAGTWLRQS